MPARPRESNDLVESLPRVSRDRMLASGETVSLEPGTRLCEAGGACTHAWFPLTGLISLATELHPHEPLGMGEIGREGMLGAELALGIDTAPLQAIVTGPGTALRLSAVALRLELGASGALRDSVDHYLYIALAQISRTAACNRFHAVGPRLARCLLLARDRAQSDRLHFTHAALGAMLGVRRSGISEAALTLSRRGAIRYTRGEIIILDRAGLKAAACSCYATWPTFHNGRARH